VEQRVFADEVVWIMMRAKLAAAFLCLGGMAVWSRNLAADATSSTVAQQTETQTADAREPLSPAARLERAAKIASLIGSLGHERYAVREAAEKELAAFGASARSALERAVQHQDAEIAARARRILTGLPELTHAVVDAFGSPVPWATVTISLVTKKEATSAAYEGITVESDDLGRIPIPALPSHDHMAVVDVYHADYGRGRYDVFAHTSETNLRLPLVREETEARRRAVEGTVSGPDGHPVAGAVVRCQHVRTPGAGLINALEPHGAAITDQDGRFHYYMPNENHDRERGELIPVNSSYHLTITVPHEQHLFPMAGMYSNLEANSIPLHRAMRFHRFRFQRADGEWIEDPRELQNIAIVFAGDELENNARVPLDQSVVAKGRFLLPGTYTATSLLGGSSVQFQPIAVTHESPEELVFRLPPAVVFRGRVVHGVTGEPVDGAFVMGFSSTARSNLALIASDDWSRLRAVELPPNPDDPAVKLLREHYGVEGLVHTDEDGRFEITQEPDEEFYGLMAFEEDFVPYKVRIFSLETKKRPVEAGEFPLFPAANVMVRPVHKDQHLSVSPQWLPAESDQPAWIDRFHSAAHGQEREFEYVHWLRLNERQPIFVPSGVRLRLRFETPYDDKWAPVVVETPVQLHQGAVHEIGDLHFAASLPAVVRVLDGIGQPVEGIPVRRKYDDGDAWCVAHNTDAKGQAYFYVHPRSHGRFRVSDISAPREVAMAENLFADFKVTGQAPAQPFEITLTDHQIELLLRAPAERP
jgi:hypothetical protein